MQKESFTYDEIMNMDSTIYAQTISEVIQNNMKPNDFSHIVYLGAGHAGSLHAGMSDADLLSRMVNAEVKSSVSTFLDKETMVRNLANAIIDKSQSIGTWMTRSSAHRMELSYVSDEKNIARGFTKDLKEKQTSSFTMVLEKNMSKDGLCPLGFYVVTAFADVDSSLSEPTGKEYDPSTVLNDENVHFRDDFSKLYFTFQQMHPNTDVFMVHHNDTIFLQARVYYDETYFSDIRVYYDRDARDPRVFVYDPDENEYVKRFPSWCREHAPEVNWMVDEYNQTYHDANLAISGDITWEETGIDTYAR